MKEEYENVVREWYLKLRDPFTHSLVQKFPSLSLDMAENIYQDAFIAVQGNIKNGRVRDDTTWSSYIYAIAVNLANKEMRHVRQTDSIDPSDDEGNHSGNKSEDLRKQIDLLYEEHCSIYDDPELKAALGGEIAHTPEPCKTIITLFYWDGSSMKEIADKIGFKGSNSVKAKKSQCMKDLTARVKNLFKYLGFGS